MQDPLLIPELREYIANNNTEALRAFCEKTPPAVAAEYLSAFSPSDIWRAIRHVPPNIGAEIFTYLDNDAQLAMTATIRREEIAALLTEMSADDRVDLLKRLPDERRDTIMPALAMVEREDIRRLSSHEEGTAGAVMTSDYATLTPDLTVSQAIEHLRREAPNTETIYYTYVVDQDRRLLGFVSLRDLIVAPAWARVGAIMSSEVVFARVDDDQETAARIIQKYDLIALPVVSHDDALVGIITHDDAFDIITQEHTEDMEKFMAIAGSHEAGVYLKTPSWVHFKKRAIWVVALAALGLVSGFIVQRFEDLLLQFAILAVFMPMLAGAGGNTGSQSAAMVLRALAVNEIGLKDVRRVLTKEFWVALLLGLLLGLIAYGRVMLFGGGSSSPVGQGLIGIAIAVSLGLQVLTSTLIGAILPLLAVRMHLDPAVVASPALSSIVDITGLLIYFTTVTLLLGI